MAPPRVTLNAPERRLTIQRESLIGGEWWKTNDSLPVVLEDSNPLGLSIVPGERLVIEFASGDGSPAPADEA